MEPALRVIPPRNHARVMGIGNRQSVIIVAGPRVLSGANWPWTTTTLSPSVMVSLVTVIETLVDPTDDQHAGYTGTATVSCALPPCGKE
jgi:hypothetical protein